MRQQSNPDLTVVIPALNEEKRLGKTLQELSRFLKNDQHFSKLKVEVIVVSADCDDNTHEVAKKSAHLFKNFALLEPGKRAGKGRDVQYGMLRAKGSAILFMDADLATPLNNLIKLYSLYESGADVVIGTRNLFKHHPHIVRRVVSNLGNLAYRVLGGVWVEDSQCGFKLFEKKAAKLCFTKQTIMGWGFDMELLTIAKINKLEIKAVRIQNWRSVPDGTFVDGILTNAVHSLKDLFHIFKNRLIGAYR